MKMIFRNLLLIKLISCVSGTFVVNVTQTSYQAEENHNITLEWTFTTKPDTSSNSVNIFCNLINDHKDLVLFHLHDGVEVSESQDQQFSGRVQFDKDVLREGRIRLQLSRLRTEDSGLYLCEVKTDDGWSSDRCRLNVTGTFVVKVTQTSYQAEENHNITLEWTFTTKPDTSSNSVNIFCNLINDHKDLVLFHLHDGVEVSESQDQQFSGRVQFDKDVFPDGQVRLHLLRLRTEDPGLYLCEVKTDDVGNVGEYRLNVTDHHQHGGYTSGTRLTMKIRN
ncbi:CD276 antigen-like isoform X1 [Channa argus]|uniref:CD276 antigen-like isoform X1 n=1 Tax=Channa argus TaxID=215402 RepID=UPI0035206A96